MIEASQVLYFCGAMAFVLSSLVFAYLGIKKSKGLWPMPLAELSKNEIKLGIAAAALIVVGLILFSFGLATEF